jgi:hypothetical protein
VLVHRRARVVPVAIALADPSIRAVNHELCTLVDCYLSCGRDRVSLGVERRGDSLAAFASEGPSVAMGDYVLSGHVGLTILRLSPLHAFLRPVCLLYHGGTAAHWKPRCTGASALSERSQGAPCTCRR